MDNLKYKADISILQSNWSGLRDTPENNFSGMPEKEIKEIIEGEMIDLKHFGSHPLEIKKIDREEISIYSTNLDIEGVSKNPIAHPESVEITLKIGESVKYRTSTMDAGGMWAITLINCKPIISESLPNETTGKTEEKPQEEKKPENFEKDKPRAKILLPKINWESTQNAIKKLEERFNAKVITFYVSLFSKMQKDQADIFFEHLKKIGYQENLVLYLFGPGGDPTAALRIATILREYCKSLTILIPSCSASAATILALSADKIIMSPAGYLTAIDASLTNPLNPRGLDGRPVSISIEQIKRIIGFLDKEGPAMVDEKVAIGTYRSLFKYVHPLVVAEISRNSSLSELIAIKVMQMHPQVFSGEEHIKEIARRLINDYPTHAFPILYQEAKNIGLPVEKSDLELSELMWELAKVYDSATQVRTTNFSPTFQHYEEFTIIVESAGFRTFYRVTLNKRFNPVIKRNDIENNLSGWFSITPSEEVPGYKINTLDVLSTVSSPNHQILPIEIPSVKPEAPLVKKSVSLELEDEMDIIRKQDPDE